MRINKKYPNFQDLYSFEDYKLVADALRTFNCGLSPICLYAPSQHTSIYKRVLNVESAPADLTIRTLRLEYAIRVWMRAALISANNPGRLLYYWWLNYQDNDTSFREVKYDLTIAGMTMEDLMVGFWKLLEDVANSGEITVHEGFSCSNQGDIRGDEPTLDFLVVLDIEDAGNSYELIDDIYAYPYNCMSKTYTWEQIKDLFIQLNLHQLSLVDRSKLHKHTAIDRMLFIACDNKDIEAVKTAVRMGADVNALDERGTSALGHAVEYFTDYGILMDKKYSEEEIREIELKNYHICVEIVDYLLDKGADIDLFGVYGMQPVTEAYYAHSVEMIKHLLERGSDPNYNSYRSDDLIRGEESCRCTILDVIGNRLWDEYDDFEKDVEGIVRQYGGRRYAWDYDVARCKHIGKYYMSVSPCTEKYLFCDNDGWGIGNENEITIEDKDGNQRRISIHVDGLREWHKVYLDNIENDTFDWQTWNDNGFQLARLVIKQLPDTVALYYPYGKTIKRLFNPMSKKHYIDTLREEILVE